LAALWRGALPARHAAVIHPPVDTERFRPGGPREDFYLIVSALAPYKRIDLAIAAANRLGKRLVVVGTGEDAHRLARLAGPTVSLLGWQSDEEVARRMASCRAFILPGEEDFGIAPLEAMACGRPVIALGRGGALETVIDTRAPGGSPPTGVLFQEPSADALAEAMVEIERREGEFDTRAIRSHAERFSTPRFREEIIAAVWRFARERGVAGA
jgi:glycosyltransferase involved in cell wall biosynthesis